VKLDSPSLDSRLFDNVAMLGPDALRAIVDALPAFVNVKDRESRYVFMNAFQAKLYGTTPEAARGRTAAELLGTRYGNYTHDIDRTVLESGQTLSNYPETYRVADGSERSFLTTKLPWRPRGGPIAGVVTIALDVTEKKAADSALAEALVRSEAANRAKSAFLANMSHEMRTPLNAVIGFAELMAAGVVKDPARVQDYANSVVSGGRRLLNVIEHVLEIAELENGTRELQTQEFELAILVRDVFADLSHDALRAGVALEAEIPDRFALHADRRAVRRMLEALLSNAVKFSNRGGIARVRAVRREDGRDEIAVVDDGIGISPEDLRRCLEPFGQVEESLVRRYGGVGLGLAAVRTFIELHGGRLLMESTLGKGTCVRLVFGPRAD
jgi:PAS domain S-box-containing protein